MDTIPAIENYFVCVGAQKAGTTWLARTLGEHPDIFVTPVKEIHYFDHIAGLTQHLNDRKRRSRHRKYHQRMWTQWRHWKAYRSQGDWYRNYMRPDLDDAWYAALFEQRGGCAMAGEATPEYALIGEEGYRHMRRLAPDARVIYIMRDPVARAWSQILHLCRSRRISASSLDVSSCLEIAGEERFEALSDYNRTIDDLHSVFDDEQLLFLFYEDVHADRAGAIKRVCNFLGVDPLRARDEELGRRFNVSQAAVMPPELGDALRRKFLGQVDGVEQRIGAAPEAWRK